MSIEAVKALIKFRVNYFLELPRNFLSLPAKGEDSDQANQEPCYMLTIPESKRAIFISALEEKEIPRENRGYYLKWVSFFLDFCHKYDYDDRSRES